MLTTRIFKSSVFTNSLFFVFFVKFAELFIDCLKTLKKIWPFLKNKYLLAIVFFLVWIVFFDQNNLIDRFLAVNKYRQMKRDKIYYIEKIKVDSKKLEELRTDRENLEKFAREQYLMKKDDEDIFIIKED